MKQNDKDIVNLLKTFTDIGLALSAEKDHSRLLEFILKEAMNISHSDGGTIYTCTEDKVLKFEIMINKSMNIHMGGTSKSKIHFPDLPLYDIMGKPNNHMVAPWAAISKKTINIKNAYTNKKYDLSGTKKFDKSTGYHSKSFLTVPMTNHLNEVIGVLQLINAKDSSGNLIPFSKIVENLVESLASQAAVTITNRQLIQAQKDLFDSLIQLIAQAIDEKSPYTGGHCRRVPVITRMIAEAACAIKKGPLKTFSMTEDELYELEVAAWLHDCGKIITPEAVVDKATKLEEIADRIHLIDLRFEIAKRDLIIDTLTKALSQNQKNNYKLEHDTWLRNELSTLDDEREFIRACNIGGEQILPEHIKTLEQIAKRTWRDAQGGLKPMLSKDELENLEIFRGTLSDKERQVINKHVSVTLKMLKSLPYPNNLKNVPELAGSHHEKVDGSGYPRGLTKDQMSYPARMIAIADIFEALTAQDRPYKKAMPLSQALHIMGKMKCEGHIDPDLFDVFIDAKIYERYAKKYLRNCSLTEIDLDNIPGYKALH